MTKNVLVIIWAVLCFLSPPQVSRAAESVDPNQIIKELVSELPTLQMPPPTELEPNLTGKYRRHTFIKGDFNKDGRADIAICAVDNPDWKMRSGDSYVLIASQTKSGSWIRVFFEKIPGVRHPFLIWVEKRRALLVGANFSDYDPGDILWDAKSQKFKLVEAKQ